MEVLEEESVVVDERRPDVVRVAPAPLYNTYVEVWEFVRIFKNACEKVRRGEVEGKGSVMVEGGQDEPGWGSIT